jgi:dTMP kinase
VTASGQHESGHRLRAALAASALGDWLGLLAATAMAASLAGNSYAEAALAVAGVLVLRLAPALLIGPVAEALAGRANRRAILVAGDLLRALLFLSIALAGSLTWLFAATLLVEGVTRVRAAAAPRGSAEAAGPVYAPALAAALTFSALNLLNGLLDNAFDALGRHPADLPLCATALVFAGSALVTARLPIRARVPGEHDRPESAIRAIAGGRPAGLSTPVVRGLLGAVAAAGAVLSLAQVYVHDLGAGQPGYGVLFAAVLLGLALGLRSGPHRLEGFSRFRLLGLSLIGAGLFLAAIALIPNMVMAALLAVGLGACAGTVWTTGQALLGPNAAPGYLAASARVVLLLVVVAGAGLAAVIGRHTVNFTDTHALAYNGAAFAFLIAAVLVVALGLATYRRLDDRPGTGLRQELSTFWSSHRTGPATPAQPEYPGVFVALEGGDGSGKSTQARLLAEWLRADQGHDVVLTREPGATPLGVRLREVLLGNASELGSRPEVLLFAADRSHHVEAVVRPALARGAIVITDRYIDSSVAYQGAGRQLDGEEVEQISTWATDGLVPALTVLLDVDPVISKSRRARDLNRGGEDRLESETDAFHERVRAQFLALARRAPHRYLVVDAGLGADEVQQLVRERVRQVLPLSARHRAQLDERLAEEDQTRERRAAAEAEVLRMDADLRRRRVAEAREREESRRRAREEAERQLQQEAERELREQESQRNREEVDRRASQAAAAAALGPVTEPVQMPGRYPSRRPAEPTRPVDPPDAWAPPADPDQTAAPGQYEGNTNPVPQAPPNPQSPPNPPNPAGPEQELPTPVRAPRTVQLPEIDLAQLEQQPGDRTITLPDGETGATGNDPEVPLRRRGRRQA